MSLQGIFDPVVRAYFENKYANSNGGGNDFKYFVMSNTDKYNASFELPAEDGTTETFEKVWDYVEPDMSNPNAVGVVIISFLGTSGVLQIMCAAIRLKGEGNAFGGISLEEGLLWTISDGGVMTALKNGTLFTAVTQDAINMFAEYGVVIPEPGVYVASAFNDDPWSVVFVGTA